MKRVSFMDCKKNVDEIIAGDYSSLSDAQPFLRLLASHGWDYMGLQPPNGTFSFSSTNHVGEVLNDASNRYKEKQRNIISNFLGFIDALIPIYGSHFSLNSLKNNSLGLFACRVAIKLFCSEFKSIQGLPPVDDEQKFNAIASLINDYTFGNGQFSTLNVARGGEGATLSPDEINTKKTDVTDRLVNWFNCNRIKELTWMPLQSSDEKTARWCWERIKALQEKEHIPLACPKLFEWKIHSGAYNIIPALESACGDQYQFAVYAYFCFVTDSFTRTALRAKLTSQYKSKKGKDNGKGRTINVVVSGECKSKFDRLSAHYNKKQADILEMLIDKAFNELSQQG